MPGDEVITEREPQKMSNSPTPTPVREGAISSNKVIAIVVGALLCDLLAFTMPLPLFPRLIDQFVQSEASLNTPASSSVLPTTFLSHTLSFVRTIRTFLFSLSSTPPPVQSSHWDLTLLGGLLASLFSLCQFIISPHLGRLSDTYGRRPVLLFSMLGNLLSAGLWVFSTSFGMYAVSRIVGGLSEGNVQISIACISDVTSVAERSKSLAFVGIAFSIAFTVGPSLGAWFSSSNFGRSAGIGGRKVEFFGKEVGLNGYAVPALVTLALLTIETIFLAMFLPETRWWKEDRGIVESEGDGKNVIGVTVERTLEERKQRLRELATLHLGFLFFFSGAEFTLTFLTYNLFSYTNMQNGKLLGFIGILSSLLQGSYVRRRTSKTNGPTDLAFNGMLVSSLSLFLLASLPFFTTGTTTGQSSSNTAILILYTAATGLAFVSATVVNSLNALASIECSVPLAAPTSINSSSLIPGMQQTIDKGSTLGTHRSRGQLGRALGPLVATVLYWVYGPLVAYAFGGIGCTWMGLKMRELKSADRGNVGKVKRA